MENLARAARHGRTDHAYSHLVATVSLLGISLLLLVSASAVQAAQPFPQLSKFCPTGTAGGQCAQASGLATSPVDGHIFEVDTRNNRVQEFTPWGEFVKAFGWSVVASGPGNKPRNEIQQLAVTATGGSFKLRYGIPGSFTAAETAAIPFQPGIEPSAAQVQSALVDAPATGGGVDPFGPGDLNVSGPAGGPWVIEFIGQYADIDFGGGNFVLETKPAGLTGGGASATLITTQPGGNFEICVPGDGDVCRDGSPGSNPGQFGGNPGSDIGPQGVAIDSSGAIFVVDRRNHRVQKYDQDGNFLLMFGGSVNQTTGEDVCTAAQVQGGNVCGSGTVGNPGSGEGQFGPWEAKPSLPTLGNYISVGPDDTVYVGDTNRIQRFGVDGSFKGQIAGSVVGELVQSLDVSPDGSLYATFVDPGASSYFTSKANVRRLDASGTQIAQLPAANPRGLAIDSQGNVFVLDVDTGTTASKILGFTAAGAPIDLDPEGPGTALGLGLLLESTGIAATSPPACGLTSTNLTVSSYTTSGTNNSIYLFGGAPDPAVCPQPSVPPVIEAQFASTVATTDATVRARINPRFWPDTRYVLQYGLGKCSEGGCTLTKPSSGELLLTESVVNTGVLTKSILLTGLEPGSTYHYRFVARSGGGGPVVGEEVTFRTARIPGEETGCPNDAFRAGPSATLPDCRAYELVSPLEKLNGDISRSIEYSVAQADPSGQRMTFSSSRAFGTPEGAPLVSQYLAQRQGAGWATANISPPRSVPSLYPLGAATEGNFFKAFSSDLCSAWVLQDTEKVLTSAAPVGVPNLYRRNNCASASYELLTTSLPPAFGPVPYSTNYFPTVQGFSGDGSRSVFRANAALAVSPGGPRPPFVCSVLDGEGSVTYRWLRDGAPIGGATQSTYTYAAADVGKTIQCQATSTDSGITSLVASEVLLVPPLPATTPPNPGFKDQNVADLPGAPAIVGDAVVGASLTCEPGPWRGSPSFAYQWFRNGAAIGAATEATYVPAPSDEGTSLQCRVTGENAGGSAISFSRSVTVSAVLPLATDPPEITGTPEVGETLTCEKGTWQGASTFSYQWLRDGTAIGGASTEQYTATAADQGKAIQCRVDAANTEATVAATAPRVVVPPPSGVAPPTRLSGGGITGTPEVGETLTCEKGTWQGASTFSYQWLRDGTAIGGASTEQYTATAADQGKVIQCQLTAGNAGGAVVAIDGNKAGAVYLAPPAPPRTVIATNNGNAQLYVSSGATLRLVSVMPNGTATTDETTAGTAWSLSPLASNAREDAVYRAVSSDASRAFWTATGPGATEGAGTGAGHLYLRLNLTEPQSAMSGGKCTEASKACTISVSAANTARFVSADPQGSRVVYMTGNASPSTGLQLFTADVDVTGSEPTVTSELVAEGVRGVVGVSEDASRIYFVSKEALTSDENSEGAEAIAGRPNLYLFDEGAPLAFVATLTAGDALEGESRPGQRSPPSPVAVAPSRRTSRVTPDGLHVAFTSTGSLTGYDNTDTESGAPDAEVFLYDASADGGDGRLLCLSCNPRGRRPAGRIVNEGVEGADDDLWAAAIIPGWNSEHQPSQLLSDNGNRVFFNAYDSLVPGDGNARADVYQWEAPGEGSCIQGSSSYSEESGGCIRLISSGQSSEDAEFLDATPSGSDVFFLTQASLVPQDYGLRDLYDARVNGGFPAPASSGLGCQGEACQSQPPPPADSTPSSNTFVGPGNVKQSKPPKRCAKGKHKAKRKGKTVCVKNKKGNGSKKRQSGSRHNRGGAR